MPELSSGGAQGIRRRFTERGLEGCVRRQNPDREYLARLHGEQEAELIRLSCSEASERRGRWSLRLFADRVDQLGVTDTPSHETARQTLEKPTPATPK